MVLLVKIYSIILKTTKFTANIFLTYIWAFLKPFQNVEKIQIHPFFSSQKTPTVTIFIFKGQKTDDLILYVSTRFHHFFGL